jgi:hypothetical protein
MAVIVAAWRVRQRRTGLYLLRVLVHPTLASPGVDE